MSRRPASTVTPPSTPSRLALGLVLVGLCALWSSTASAQPSSEVVFVAPFSSDGSVDWRELEQVRQIFSAQLRSTGRLFVIEPSLVADKARARGCAPSDRSCIVSLANDLGVTIMISPAVWAVGEGTDRQYVYQMALTDPSYSWESRSVSTTVPGPVIWATLRAASEDLIEGILDYVDIDPDLRWRSPPIDEDSFWVSLHLAMVPWGTGNVAVKEQGGSSQTEVPYNDDAFYGFGLSMAWLWSRLSLGLSVWWLPSAEFELDGHGRATLRAFDAHSEDSIIGRSGDSTDEIDFNLSTTGLLSAAELFNDGSITELFFYLTLEGGPVLAIPDAGDDLSLPFGWNGVAETGVQIMADRHQAIRLGVRTQLFQLHQDVEGDDSRIPPRGTLDASVEGLRLMIVLTSTAGGD